MMILSYIYIYSRLAIWDIRAQISQTADRGILRVVDPRPNGICRIVIGRYFLFVFFRRGVYFRPPSP